MLLALPRWKNPKKLIHSNFLEDYVDIKGTLNEAKENTHKKAQKMGYGRKSSFVAFSSGVSEDGWQSAEISPDQTI